MSTKGEAFVNETSHRSPPRTPTLSSVAETDLGPAPASFTRPLGIAGVACLLTAALTAAAVLLGAHLRGAAIPLIAAAVLTGCALSLGVLLRGSRRTLTRVREHALINAAVLRSLDRGMLALDRDGRVSAVNPAAETILGRSAREMLGTPLGELLSVALVPGQTRELTVEHEDGLPVEVAVELQSVVWQGERAGSVVSLQDITDRRREEESVIRRASQQAALAAIGQAALGGVSLGVLLDHAAALVAETLPGQLVSVLELEPDGRALRYRTGVGYRLGVEDHEPIVVDTSTYAGRVLASEQPVVVEDLGEESRFLFSPLLAEHGAVSGVTVAIGGSERPWGVLSCHTTERRRIEPEDVRFMQTMAHLLGSAIERDRVARRLQSQHLRVTQLASERGRLVAETLQAEERARRSLSEFLHDESLQELFFVRQEIQEARASSPEELDRAIAGIDRAIAQLRRAISDLHPAALEQLGLEAALGALVERQSELGRYEAEVTLVGHGVGGHETLLLSLARELLTNVAKHAEASHVQVRVECTGGQVRLTVRDDGRGMEPDRSRRAVAAGHIGLASARHRVEAADGSLSIDSAPGRGTEVHVSLPVGSPSLVPAFARGAGDGPGGEG